MAGLTVVAEMIGTIAVSARHATTELTKAISAAKAYNEGTGGSFTSAMERAAGGGDSTMGASPGGPVTANSLSLALRQNQGRL